MAAKKTPPKSTLISAYMKAVLTSGERPKNPFVFAQDQGMKESDFYLHFSSFEALEQAIFSKFVEETIALLEKNEEYPKFAPKEKLLSFYFTFFDLLSKNRSYVVQALEGKKNTLRFAKVLDSMKEVYQSYFEGLQIPVPDLKLPKMEKYKDKGVKEMAYSQLLFTIKFWLEDTSRSFEKTDVFIEKSIQTGFELMDLSPLESLFDLGKFLVKERTSIKL